MKDPQDYFNQIQHSGKQLISNFSYYDRLLEKGIVVSPFFPENESGNKQARNWFEENRVQIKQSGEYLNEYSGSQISRDVISGALLQIAYMALKLFAEKIEISELPKFVKENIKENWHQSLTKFSHDRKVWGLPIGLLIYAARNQYNHFEERSYNNPTQSIINEICRKDPMTRFFLDKYETRPISYIVIEVLGWQDHQNFETDIKELIGIMDT